MADFQSSRTARQIESTLVGAVQFNEKQSLSESEKARARENIGAGSSDSGMTILGFFNTLAELEAGVPEPSPGVVYGVGEEAPYDIYVWDALNNVWKNNGNIRGADGTNGSDAIVTAGAVVGALGYTPEAQTLFYVNTNVAKELFMEQGNPESDKFPFKAKVPLAGITVNHFVDIVFNFAEMVSGNYAPIADSYEGGIYLYAAEQPKSDFVIPTIHATKIREEIVGSLPSGYLPVEYVESEGAYINLGFKPTNNTRLWGKFDVEQPTSDYTQIIGNNDMSFAYGAGNKAAITYGGNSVQPSIGEQEMPAVLDFDKANFRFGTYQNEMTAASFNSNQALYVFAKNDNGTITPAKAKTKLFYLNIYENGVMQRQFVPCYRIAGQAKAGLFDLITQLFYEPVVGTLSAGESF